MKAVDEYAFAIETETPVPYLALLMGREHVYQSVYRLDGVVGVERAYHEMAGLGGRNGRGDGFKVAHLADEYHVRVLAQNVPQRGGEAARIGPDLALVDDRALVLVEELYRVFDGDYVHAAPPGKI